MTISPFKRALIRAFGSTADAALVAGVKSRRAQAAEADHGNDDGEDPSDCLPCKAMERRRRAEAAVRGEPLEQ